MANLLNYENAEVIGTATVEQILASQQAAKRDGGSGVIEADGVSCYADATVEYRVRVWDEGASDEWYVVDGTACDEAGRRIKRSAITSATLDLTLADDGDDLEQVVIDSWSDGYDGDVDNIRAEVTVF